MTPVQSVKLPPNINLHSNTAAQEWPLWKVLFEDYLVATNNVESDDKIKLSLLRNLMGPEATKILINLPISEKQKTDYESVLKAIDAYAFPRKNVVFDRFIFNNRNQKEGEPFETFLGECRAMLKACNFELDKQNINESLLRDKIVCGIRDKNVQESLLRMDGLTLEKAANFCRASEISKIQVEKLNASSTEAIEIDAAERSYRNRANQELTRKFKCTRCGFEHGARACPAYLKQCNKCKKLNHFANMCKSRINIVQIQNENTVSHENSRDSSENLFCYSAFKDYSTDWMEKIKIEDSVHICKLDTGADISIMPEKVFNKIMIKSNLRMRPTSVKLEAFDGSKITPKGMVNLKCGYKNKEAYIDFMVVPTARSLLLSSEGCIKLNLVQRVSMVNIESPEMKLINKHKHVFTGSGKFLNTECNIPTVECAGKICCPSQRIPHKLMQPLRVELDRLVGRKAITQILQSRMLRTQLPCSVENLKSKIPKNVKEILEMYHNKYTNQYNKYVRKKANSYEEGEEVVFKTAKDSNWQKAIVLKTTNEPRSYWIKPYNSNTKLRRNTTQLRKSNTSSSPMHNIDDPILSKDNDFCLNQSDPLSNKVSDNSNVITENTDVNNSMCCSRSGRIIKKPARYLN
ncbi:hypothetical protein ACJJTC_005141 [Scirpophaga incertulas]